MEGPITEELINKMTQKRQNMNFAGGHALFLGQVRSDVIDEKCVELIEYSSYDVMVNKEITAVIASITAKYSDIQSVEILHSKGIVRAGEVSLAVFCSSGHRKAAFAALAETVELIKANVPIWKKEVLKDGGHKWTEAL